MDSLAGRTYWWKGILITSGLFASFYERERERRKNTSQCKKEAESIENKYTIYFIQ
jgi:hypothetical protein